MEKTLFTLLVALATGLGSSAQDTFSIVAVDSITGEVGSAGASCLDDSDIAGGVFIISDVLPGKGAIHTPPQRSPAREKRHTQTNPG